MVFTISRGVKPTLCFFCSQLQSKPTSPLIRVHVSNCYFLQRSLCIWGDYHSDSKPKISSLLVAVVYKRDPTSKESLNVTGSEYYDNNIPYEGIYPTIVKKIVKSSKGGIKNITYTHRSRVSSDLHPESSFTAAIQDIQDGLVDMSVGPFWITSERLLMAAFTVPVINDKIYLVVPTPGSTETITQQISKVFDPFTPNLWCLVAVVIIVSSLLSVWFSDPTEFPSDSDEVSRPLRRSKRAYLRLAVDSILEKGIFFCSAGVEQDTGATLSNKLLMFGFGFFILIVVRLCPSYFLILVTTTYYHNSLLFYAIYIAQCVRCKLGSVLDTEDIRRISYIH
mmetsp:Transcript_23990/g.43164  ORF Transcript_23990/g.43164 Transcript_23990/m.43164 type:complete len:337 (+) Transcript_23990:534-1544(+)